MLQAQSLVLSRPVKASVAPEQSVESTSKLKALAEWESASHATPDRAEVWYHLARLYEEVALDSFQQLDKIAPEPAELLALAGYFELEREQNTRAFHRFRQALAMQPSLEGLHSAIADIYLLTGHADWARVERHKEVNAAACRTPTASCNFASGSLQKLVFTSSSTADALYWKSRAALTLSHRARARLDKLPRSAEASELAAVHAEKTGHYIAAANSWKQAIGVAPGNLFYKRRLVIDICQSNDCASAMPILKELLRLDASSPETNYLYGLALASVQQPKRAIQYLQAAVNLDPRNMAARGALGEAYLQSGDSARAIPLLEAALAQDGDGRRFYQLARAYQMAGEHEKAEATLRQYKKILQSRPKEDERWRIEPPQP